MHLVIGAGKSDGAVSPSKHYRAKYMYKSNTSYGACRWTLQICSNLCLPEVNCDASAPRRSKSTSCTLKRMKHLHAECRYVNVALKIRRCACAHARPSLGSPCSSRSPTCRRPSRFCVASRPSTRPISEFAQGCSYKHPYCHAIVLIAQRSYNHRRCPGSCRKGKRDMPCIGTHIDTLRTPSLLRSWPSDTSQVASSLIRRLTCWMSLPPTFACSWTRNQKVCSIDNRTRKPLHFLTLPLRQ